MLKIALEDLEKACQQARKAGATDSCPVMIQTGFFSVQSISKIELKCVVPDYGNNDLGLFSDGPVNTLVISR